AALVIVGILAGIATVASNKAAEEPADDARTAARLLSGLNLVPESLAAPPSAELNQALIGLASGKLAIYRAPDQTKYDVRPTVQLRHVHSISIADSTGKVWASSDPAMLGLSLAGSADERFVNAVDATLGGSTDLGRNSELASSSIALERGAAGVG